jgi:hypothetical protein
MGVPSASWSCSVGWGSSGTPEVAMAWSCEVITSLAVRAVLVNLASSDTPSTVAMVK